jgi:AhpD family alkylhydroperoxidase
LVIRGARSHNPCHSALSSPFSAPEREPIAAYVSGLNHYRYCHAVHTATAERLGVLVGHGRATARRGQARVDP